MRVIHIFPLGCSRRRCAPCPLIRPGATVVDFASASAMAASCTWPWPWCWALSCHFKWLNESGERVYRISYSFDILMLAIYGMNQDHKLVRLYYVYQILLCAFLYLLRKSVELEAIKQNKNRPSNKPLGRRRVTKPPLKNMLNLQV